ncbi:hypothetical protein C9374_002793 [Naegleria lovaniensis]|uniref:Uncharacterized protein n=1 Tax=Naegleria lovaniensis TaxID=51637 RepID=A0AA88GPA3_NAELO|nr:uncharacterized protein C9374_002793 [Naegleria lovaniensis]KAG2386347.1 hypothetical protein C9374_002793 [Naegleria lovaniensis]
MASQHQDIVHQDNNSDESQYMKYVLLSDNNSTLSNSPTHPTKTPTKKVALVRHKLASKKKTTSPSVSVNRHSQQPISEPVIQPKTQIDGGASQTPDYWRMLLLEAFEDKLGGSGNMYTNDELYNFIINQSSLSITTASEWKARINTLLHKFEQFFTPLDSSYGADKIKSKGYKRVLEVLHKLACVSKAARMQQEFNFQFTLDSLELCELLSRLLMVFINEGTENNSFEAADDFISGYIATDNYLEMTEKEREKIRKRVQQKHQEDAIKNVNSFVQKSMNGRLREKDQSTRLPYEYYCCFPSPEHINYIVIGEFERACRTFAMLSDAEYEAPTIHTLLFNLNIPGIEVLLTKEFKLKQYSNNDIVEFDKLEQQWNRTHQPHNMLQNFKNKQSNAHITIGGITYHKQQIEKPEANDSQFRIFKHW